MVYSGSDLLRRRLGCAPASRGAVAWTVPSPRPARTAHWASPCVRQASSSSALFAPQRHQFRQQSVDFGLPAQEELRRRTDGFADAYGKESTRLVNLEHILIGHIVAQVERHLCIFTSTNAQDGVSLVGRARHYEVDHELTGH